MGMGKENEPVSASSPHDHSRRAPLSYLAAIACLLAFALMFARFSSCMFETTVYRLSHANFSKRWITMAI